MQESLINLQKLEHTREGEKILERGLQHKHNRVHYVIGDVRHAPQESALKVAVLSILIILGGVFQV